MTISTGTMHSGDDTFIGRYELTTAKFDETLKDEPRENILPFDLKPIFPDELENSTHLPKLLDKLWRRVLDGAISETGGAYTPVKGSTFVKIWLETVPSPAAGRARLASISERMTNVRRIVRAEKNNPEAVLDAQFIKKETEQRRAPNLSPELALLMREGLPLNPAIGVMNLWIERSMQNLIHAKPQTAFIKDIIDVVGKSDVFFTPVWTPVNEMIVGTFSGTRVPIAESQHTSAEIIRQDLVMAFSMCFQQINLLNKKIKSIGFVTLKTSMLAHKEGVEMLVVFLQRVPAEVKNNIIFEIKGLKLDSISSTIKKSLQDLSAHCKAFSVDTGIFSQEDFSNHIPKLQLCGFDLTGSVLPEVEIVSLMRKYRESHQKKPQKNYIKALSSVHMIKVAKECGYSFLSGPIIHPPEKICRGMRAYPIRL